MSKYRVVEDGFGNYFVEIKEPIKGNGSKIKWTNNVLTPFKEEWRRLKKCNSFEKAKEAINKHKELDELIKEHVVYEE